jgi:hypothetical protein
MEEEIFRPKAWKSFRGRNANLVLHLYKNNHMPNTDSYKEKNAAAKLASDFELMLY